MATKIIHKKSSVASSVPSAGDLEPGELAVNLADQKIYSKTTGGTVIEMSPTEVTDSIIETAKNVSGGSLSIGTPVYQSGTSGNAMEVQAARADTSGSMPAVGLLNSTLADEAEGSITLIGLLKGLNTASYSEGDTLYVAATGGLTTTPPTGESNLIQNIGKVIKVHASNGSIMVTGAGRANATPNLDDGAFFLGNGSNQSVATDFDTAVEANSKVAGIEANATADQTAAEILTAIKTVDGASSGLDADLLDGKQGDNYVQGTNANRTTNITNISTALPSGFFDGYQVTGTPTSTWYTYINSRYNNTNTNHGSQIACSFYNAGDFYVRNIDDGTYGSWKKIWNEANDGSGSGLDADTVDNIEASSFLRSDASDSFSGTITNSGTFVSYQNSNTPTTNLKFGRSSSQYYTLHGGSSGNFLSSVSAADNQKPYLKFGYSVDGGASHASTYTLNGSSGTLWHSGNDGASSGLDADTVDGIEASAFLQTSGGTMTGNLSFGDNVELRLGDNSGSAMILEHTGSIADIRNGSGNMYIRNFANDQDVYIQSDDGSGGTATYFTADGSTGEAKMHHYGSEKLNTTSTGVDVTGTVKADLLEVGASNVNLRTPTGNFGSLEIDGGAAGSWEGYSIGGRLVFMHNNSNNGGIYNDVNNQWMVYGTLNGAIDLRYAGSAKLTTTNTGVDVTGALTTSDEVVAEVVSYAANQNAPYMIAATTGYTGATTSSGTYGLQHRFKYDSGGSPRITVDGVIGGVETELWALYGGNGNMDVYGSLDVRGNILLGDNQELRFGDSNDLFIKFNGTNGSVTNATGHLYLANTANDQDVVIQSDDGAGGVAHYFRADGSTGEAQLFHYGSEKLNTKSTGVAVTGDLTVDSTTLHVDSTNNRVGIGLTNPGCEFHIFASTPQVRLQPTGDTQNNRIEFCNAAGTIQSRILSGGVLGSTIQLDGDVEVVAGHNVTLPDNVELRFGNSNDLIIEHNASNGDIRNNTNDLLIRNLANDRDVRILSDNGSGSTADYFRADGSTGEAMLYHYGSEKFATKSGGAEVTGDFTATGNVTAYSDERLKENIKPIESAVDKVKQLRGVTYDWKATGEASVGVIAQEVEAVFPELVKENDTYKSVDYSKLTSVLIEAIKDQQKQIDELKAKLGD